MPLHKILVPNGIRESKARTIVTPVSGFLREAGFTHSLSPARNCTYGCLYCYVPTLRIFGGLKREDWERWGQFTTFKRNAADLVPLELASDQTIYCSPLVDPYQPAEREYLLMPKLIAAVTETPPNIFVIQTRGPLILRDLELLCKLGERTTLRISFSVTTNREEVRRRYEPHCEPNRERLEAIRTLRRHGLEVHATLAPLLPCDPEELAVEALEASGNDLIGDPLHVRATKRAGATSRAASYQLAERLDQTRWFDPAFQSEIVERIAETAHRAGRSFTTGPAGFGLLARPRAISEDGDRRSSR